MIRAAAVAIAVILAGPAVAGDLPRGLGHPTDGSHWYDMTCCNMQDCEQVEPGAITRTATGLAVRYRSSRGHVAAGFIKWGDPGIRPSRDGAEHACSYSDGRVLCVYLPPES